MAAAPNRRPPAILFDLDGTLIDTLVDITFAVNQVLAEFSFPPVGQQRMRAIIGEGLTTLLQRATGIHDAAVIATMVERYKPIYEGSMLQNTRLYNGVKEMLNAIADRNASMCVLSNKPHLFTEPICAALLSPWPFVRCLGHRDGTPRKPDPTAAWQLASEMNADPSDVFFVGDSAIDIQTARAAGMIPVAVTWGFRDVKELQLAEPAYLLDIPMQLVSIVTAGSV
ncbi:MAG: HAD family hydrolase [Phycisphaerales bacterium]|nr:HAD family hydrolase [Phycisphaerales bacterium]